MKKFKKVIATVIATTAMAISLISLSVSAYSPTINKPFGDGATATLYADISHASASTACPGVECVVTLTYNSLQRSGYSSDYASACLAYTYKTRNIGGLYFLSVLPKFVNSKKILFLRI